MLISAVGASQRPPPALDRDAAEGALVIGLVGAAAPKPGRAAEPHFERLLAAAAPGRVVLRHFALAGPGWAGMEEIEALWEAKLDGLIVTGTEPRAATMAEEPIWPDLARLVDWAGANTLATIWSCFSAHAAVYRLDGIDRQALPEKLSGVFDCGNTGNGVMAGLPGRYKVPHSRCNTLAEEALLDHGYTILSRAAAVGADSFAKPHLRSQFLFLQGHGEYGPRTLAAEYSRDIGRFLAGTHRAYPVMPRDYFAPETEAAFAALRARALRAPETGLFAGFGWQEVKFRDHDWQGPAQRLYADWLAGIAAQKVLHA